ncbi:VOC family protein [Phenylobacterium sp.]|uniref:VOC family protein n=1 Tax=Phenylobacterium sp. TaxID=1871053 RepID=UPI003D2CC746
MTIGSLGYLGLRVKDPAAFDAYATGVLGLMPGETAGCYRLDDMAWRIAVEAGDADDVAFLGFEVAGPAEMEALRARLAAAGVAVGNGDPERLAARQVLGMVTCEDPDGLPVEIFYGPTLRTEAPFASPAGVGGFVTGDQGLGHVVLSTKDMDASRRFYQDLLGFRLSDVIRMQMSPEFGFDMEFFHCNPRHHTLALMPLPLPKRLHHFMVQVAELDELGFALERATAAGAPITASLGRHTNDQMVSFYSQTPAGFEVEFGQGAVEVDVANWRVSRHDRPSSWGHHRPSH